MSEKLYVSWLHEKYQYHNLFFFSGENPETLDNIRKKLQTNSTIFGKNKGEFPGGIRLFMGRHGHEIPGSRFFFRSWYDIETNKTEYENDVEELFSLFENNSKALLFTEHPNKYVKMFSEMVLRDPMMNDIEIVTNHIHLDPEDELKKIVI